MLNLRKPILFLYLVVFPYVFNYQFLYAEGLLKVPGSNSLGDYISPVISSTYDGVSRTKLNTLYDRGGLEAYQNNNSKSLYSGADDFTSLATFNLASYMYAPELGFSLGDKSYLGALASYLDFDSQYFYKSSFLNENSLFTFNNNNFENIYPLSTLNEDYNFMLPVSVERVDFDSANEGIEDKSQFGETSVYLNVKDIATIRKLDTLFEDDDSLKSNKFTDSEKQARKAPRRSSTKQEFTTSKLDRKIKFFYMEGEKTKSEEKASGILIEPKSSIPFRLKFEDKRTLSYSEIYHCADQASVNKFLKGEISSCQQGFIITELESRADLFCSARESAMQDVLDYTRRKMNPDELRLLSFAKLKYGSHNKLENVKKRLLSGNKNLSLEDLISYVVEAGKEFNVPPYLILSIIEQESWFNPLAKSKKKAIGLMQIIPSQAGEHVASMLGINDFKASMLKDPRTNIRFGTKYISYLLKRYNGDLEKALTAYNWGPGRVDRRGKTTKQYSSSVLNRLYGYYLMEEFSKKHDSVLAQYP